MSRPRTDPLGARTATDAALGVRLVYAPRKRFPYVVLDRAGDGYAQTARFATAGDVVGYLSRVRSLTPEAVASLCSRVGLPTFARDL